MQTPSSLELTRICVSMALSRNAEQIQVIDLRAVEFAPAAFFVVCTANSSVNARAIADKIREGVQSMRSERAKSEGEEQAQWIILDYFDVVVHILQREQRDFYKLEKLWGDGTMYLADAHGEIPGLQE